MSDWKDFSFQTRNKKEMGNWEKKKEISWRMERREMERKKKRRDRAEAGDVLRGRAAADINGVWNKRRVEKNYFKNQ